MKLVCALCHQIIKGKLTVHVMLYHPQAYQQLKAQEKHRYEWK